MHYFNRLGLFAALSWATTGHAATVAKSGPQTLILRVLPKEAAMATPGKLLKLILANGRELVVTVKDKSKSLIVVEFIDSAVSLAKGEQLTLQSAVANEEAREEKTAAGNESSTKSPATAFPFYSRIRRESDDPTVFILHHDRPIFLGELASSNSTLTLKPKKAFATGPTALPKVESKASQSMISLEGSWQSAAGIFFGGQVQLLDSTTKTNANAIVAQSKDSSSIQEISLYAAIAVNENVGLSLALVRNDLDSKTVTGGAVGRDSQNVERLIPSVLLANRGSELILSWRPTMGPVGLAGHFQALGLVSLKGSTYAKIVVDRTLIRGIESQAKDPTSLGLGVGHTGRVFEMLFLATAYEKVGALDNPNANPLAFSGYGVTLDLNYHVDASQGVGAELLWQDRKSDVNFAFDASLVTTTFLARYFYKF